MEIKKTVQQLLIDYPETRDNDNLLIAMILKEKFGTTDIKIIADKTKKNYCESIRRSRQKLQQQNPLLRGSKPVRVARLLKEAEVKEWARNG